MASGAEFPNLELQSEDEEAQVDRGEFDHGVFILRKTRAVAVVFIRGSAARPGPARRGVAWRV